MAEQWHYHFVSLLANTDPRATSEQAEADVTAVKETVAKLGLDGWEAVGQVTISTTHSAPTGEAVRLDSNGLLMKRPAAAAKAT